METVWEDRTEKGSGWVKVVEIGGNSGLVCVKAEDALYVATMLACAAYTAAPDLLPKAAGVGPTPPLVLVPDEPRPHDAPAQE